ncbi:MAG: hypothetical protein LBQ65_10535 [Tannerellaceae bacterium]|jgi:hypothetical protein|nr:hypothetical protein [Tannerellaceae bacterium]
MITNTWELLLLIFLGMCALGILYLLARLLYRSFLILTGQEWKSSNKAWALAGVKRISRQETLMEVALKAPVWEARREAVKKITDQEFLKKVVNREKYAWEVRREAVAKLTDQEFLKKIAIADSQVCLKAVEKIANQKFLKEVARKSYNSDASESAVKKITDQKYLKELSIEASKSVCKAAWKKITNFDQEFLKEIAIHASDYDVRREAVAKLTDQECLKEVALKDSDRNVRLEAAEKLLEISGDQTPLEAIVSALAKNLKTSDSTSDKRTYAGYLQTIYKRHPNSSIRDQIRPLNLTMIYAGRSHSDITGVHSDSGHTDRYDNECANCPCGDHTDVGYGAHTDNPDSHTDISAEPAEYLCLE